MYCRSLLNGACRSCPQQEQPTRQLQRLYWRGTESHATYAMLHPQRPKPYPAPSTPSEIRENTVQDLGCPSVPLGGFEDFPFARGQSDWDQVFPYHVWSHMTSHKSQARMLRASEHSIYKQIQCIQPSTGRAATQTFSSNRVPTLSLDPEFSAGLYASHFPGETPGAGAAEGHMGHRTGWFQLPQASSFARYQSSAWRCTP